MLKLRISWDVRVSCSKPAEWEQTLPGKYGVCWKSGVYLQAAMNYFRFFVSASAKAVLVRMAISFYRSQHRVTPRYFVKLALSTSVPTCPNKEVWSVVKTIWIYLGVPGDSLY